MLRSTGEAEIQRLPLADETRPQNALGQIRISFRVAPRQVAASPHLAELV